MLYTVVLPSRATLAPITMHVRKLNMCSLLHNHSEGAAEVLVVADFAINTDTLIPGSGNAPLFIMSYPTDRTLEEAVGTNLNELTLS